MAIAYKIFPDVNLLVTRYSGQVTNAEFLETYAAIAGEQCRRSGMAELALLNDVLSIDLTLKTMRSVSQSTARQLPAEPMRTAVVSSKPMHQIMSRLYRSMAEMGGVETVRQFEDLTEALAWLDCSDFPPERLEEVPRS